MTAHQLGRGTVSVTRSKPKSRPPSEGVCVVCLRHVGVEKLVWDHCHDCGVELGFRGWICGNCNTALTRHLIHNWDAASSYLLNHQCSPNLFDMPLSSRPKTVKQTQTERCYFGNGKNDPRYIMVSVDKSFITVEQLSAVLGVAAGTARDKVRKRRGDGRRSPLILVPLSQAFEIIRKNWKL